MRKSLIIGIDLSFNSTGITVSYLEDGEGKLMEFYRLVYETTPNPIENINQQTYTLPTNVSVIDLIVEDSKDAYSEDQALITLKAMICCKRIMKIVCEVVDRFKPNDIYFNIEGFVMPSMTGSQQLRVLGGLIMLQGQLRSDLIKLKLSQTNIDDFKIYITSPSELKLFFTGNGSADKQMMLDYFLDLFDGDLLLPNTESLGKVNDVVDSFALMLNCFYRLHTKKARKLTTFEKKKIKKQLERKAAGKKEKPVKEKPTILFL